MSLWSRAVSAWQGARYGWAGYNTLNSYASSAWSPNDAAARLSDYAIFERYANNTVYSNIHFFADAVAAGQKRYKWTEGIYNPVKRLIDLYEANVFQGGLDTEDLGAGALPLAFDNDALQLPLQQVMKWSNLAQQLARYVHEAALYGDGFWWIVDDPGRRRVRMELLHPSKVRDLNVDEVGNVRAAVIEYEREEDAAIDDYQPQRFGSSPRQRKTYVYTLKATKRDVLSIHFATFKDGEPFGFYADASGALVAEWEAPYPFVPLKHAMFEPTDEGWGRNAFYASRTKIDQVNSVASQLNASVRRVIEPILLAKNVSVTEVNGQRKLDFSSQRDDATNIATLFVNGEGVDIQPLVVPLDLAAAGQHIQDMLLEIERDMPVLALQRIREQGALTAPGVRSGYSDAIGRIEGARKNLDPPLAASLQMAITMGGIRRYDGFQGFDADSYDRGDMDLRVKERAVMPDELTTAERLNAYGTIKDLPGGLLRRALMDMNVPSAEIDEIVGAAEAAQNSARQDQITANDASAVQALLDNMGLPSSAGGTMPPLLPAGAGKGLNGGIPA